MFRVFYNVKFYLGCALIAFLLGCKENKDRVQHREIFLPENLQYIEIDNSTKFEQNWFDNKHKVVVFVKKAGPYSALDLEWQAAISEFPDVAFLFYVSEKDSTKLINHLKDVGFTHPVIHDPNEEFRKLNVKERELTFISFLVKDKEVVGMSNPSLVDFNKKLQELLKE